MEDRLVHQAKYDELTRDITSKEKENATQGSTEENRYDR